MKIILKISLGVVAFVLVIMAVITFVVNPLIRKKIQTAFNENSVDYNLKIGNVHLSVFKSGIELENIIVQSVQVQNGLPDLTGMIASVKFKEINIWKIVFNNDFEVSEVTISDSEIKGKILLKKQTKTPKISTINIRIDNLFFNNLGVEIKDSSTANEYVLKDAFLKAYNLRVNKLDTFAINIIGEIDFDVQEFNKISADSMYTYNAIGMSYSGNSQVLSVNHFTIHPNYPNYEFTSLFPFETDRIEAEIDTIHFYNFSISEFLKTKNIMATYVEIGKMDLNAFRDKRRPFRHVDKPSFQDMIYNYPGKIDVDSIAFLSGNISYTEHAEKADEPGIIRFNEVYAMLYNITNDTIFKTEMAYMVLKTNALVMGKGRLEILLKAQIFDDNNTFSVDGSLSGMDAKELNPMLTNNAFINVSSGWIDDMKFSFTANNAKAFGRMTFLYHGLDIAVVNKQTDDTKGVIAWFLSLFANKIIMNSNPIPNEDVRRGIIDYERDPEKFMINYCFKSMLSGIKSSLDKAPRKTNN